MNIAVLAGDKQWNELMNDAVKTNCTRIKSIENFSVDEDVLLILEELPLDFISFKIPVLINSVCNTLDDLQAPENVIRLNEWISFLSPEKWDIIYALLQKLNIQNKRYFAAPLIKQLAIA